ncbi:hypothetical protein BW41_03291 [Sphingomonas sp. RIT328]|nr:hypothetical protein BW41_03291 [Sphingomonas sp. RIT328]
MRHRGLSQSDVAELLGVTKATVSRMLSRNAFSTDLRERTERLLSGGAPFENATMLLHKSLRIIAECDRLLDAARALTAQALDLAERKQ